MALWNKSKYPVEDPKFKKKSTPQVLQLKEKDHCSSKEDGRKLARKYKVQIKKRKPTTRGIPRRSPIQVLTGPDVA